MNSNTIALFIQLMSFFRLGLILQMPLRSHSIAEPVLFLETKYNEDLFRSVILPDIVTFLP